tara:strand:+ start:3962 stop:4324 length:363 start_codon:yes stop_codon:yes gene_type:complete
VGKKKSKHDDSKKFILIFSALLLLGLIASYFFYISGSENYGDSSCDIIADSQERADCYTRLAANTGNVGYCINTNYWFEECLDTADPNHAADSELLQEICNAVTDSSKRVECSEYVEENY